MSERMACHRGGIFPLAVVILWTQVIAKCLEDCRHIINACDFPDPCVLAQYNTCFWNLVKDGVTPEAAQAMLKASRYNPS